MAERALKGMVLAAGLGTRLKPLTAHVPKPLVPFLGTHALALAIERLVRAGIRDIAINAHYCAEQIASYARTCTWADLHISREEPALLGTGGAYNPIRPWLGDADLVVLNGDIVSDIDVAALVRTHQEASAVATMALLADVIPGENGVHHRDGRVVAIGGRPPADCASGNFACTQVLSRAFIDGLPPAGSFDVISRGYAPELARQAPVAAMLHRGLWHDLRDPRYYHAAVMDSLRFVDDPDDRLGLQAVWRRQGHRPRISAERVVVERGANLAEGPVLSESVVFPGASVAGSRKLSRALILPSQVIELGS